MWTQLSWQASFCFCLSFKIGQSEVYLISPDTKKIALEKNFKEISFCSQVSGDGLLAQLQLNFLVNSFTLCLSTEVLKLVRRTLSKCWICGLAFLAPLLWYIKAKYNYNFETRNFALSSRNLLEKIDRSPASLSSSCIYYLCSGQWMSAPGLPCSGPGSLAWGLPLCWGSTKEVSTGWAGPDWQEESPQRVWPWSWALKEEEGSQLDKERPKGIQAIVSVALSRASMPLVTRGLGHTKAVTGGLLLLGKPQGQHSWFFHRISFCLPQYLSVNQFCLLSPAPVCGEVQSTEGFCRV